MSWPVNNMLLMNKPCHPNAAFSVLSKEKRKHKHNGKVTENTDFERSHSVWAWVTKTTSLVIKVAPATQMPPYANKYMGSLWSFKPTSHFLYLIANCSSRLHLGPVFYAVTQQLVTVLSFIRENKPVNLVLHGSQGKSRRYFTEALGNFGARIIKRQKWISVW